MLPHPLLRCQHEQLLSQRVENIEFPAFVHDFGIEGGQIERHGNEHLAKIIFILVGEKRKGDSPRMDSNKAIATIKAGKPSPIYLLHGEEPYYIDMVSDYIEHNILNEGQRGFDQTVLYGKDTDFPTIINIAKRYPMMSDYQVVIVKEAQNLDWKNDELFQRYVEQPTPTTILVLAYKFAKFDKRKKLYKLIDKAGTIVESAKVYDNKLAGWVTAYLSEKGRKIHPQAAALIGEHLGANLSKVANELEKLILNVPKEQQISVKDVSDNIGISKDFNSFELTSALVSRNVVKSLQIADYFGANPKSNPPPLVFAALNNYFSKLLKYHYLPDKAPNQAAKDLSVNPFFIREYETGARTYNKWKTVQVISYLREYDLKSKGVNAYNLDPRDLWRELIYKILST